MLQAFDQHTLLEPHTAKQDKIDIKIDGWTIEGNDPSTYMLLSELSDQSVPITNSTETAKFFNRPQGNRSYNPSIQFSGGGAGGRVVANIPLISGRLAASRRTEYFALNATLSINPTRFVRHRGATLRTDADPALWANRVDPNLLLTKSLPSRNQDEIILDGNDNVLLAQRARYAARPEVWYAQVHLYWNNILSFFDTQISAAALTQTVVGIDRTLEYNLRQVEIYWEFFHEDALHAVASLMPQMQSLGRETSVRNYPISEEILTGNSLSVRVKLTGAITCSLYAKTTKRIRLEIKHDLMENAKVIGGSHTSTDPDALIGWLQSIARDAAQRGQNVMGHLTRIAQQSPPAACIRASKPYRGSCGG